MPTQIAITQGDDRRQNIRQALQFIAPGVNIKHCRHILIKPNFVSTVRQLAATHVDAVRAVLDFVRRYYDGPVSIAEGAALAPTMQGFERFGYYDLIEPYNVNLVDLNACETVPARIVDRHLRLRTVRLARPVVESDFRISVGPPKTHNVVIVSLSIKNMVMGSLVNPSLARPNSRSVEAIVHPTSRIPGQSERRAPQVVQLVRMALPGDGRSDKLAMHQGFPQINLNIAMLASRVLPHLVVIDGFQGMEGSGPNNGDPVDWRIAVAGTDAVAVDCFTAYLMGFNPSQIGYLVYCHQRNLGIGDLDKIEVLGGIEPDAVRHIFRPHPSTQRQLDWKIQGAERLLEHEGV